MAEWACVACTFLNADAMGNCEMCGGLKPSASQDTNLPIVLENYLAPAQEELAAAQNDPNADFKESEPTEEEVKAAAAMAGITTLLDGVRRLLEKDRYIYYQPVSEVSKLLHCPKTDLYRSCHFLYA